MQEALWFLITIGILIPIHEYGHYRVAVACNVKVLRFSIGFGRVLWRRNFGKDRTEFVISMLPLGGYVRMLDERDADVDPADLPRSFNRRPLWQRSLVIAAGPVANLLLAAVLYSFIQWHGHYDTPAVASEPAAGSLMAKAGLRSGDRIVAYAEGASVEGDAWQPVRSFTDVVEGAAGAMMDREPLRLQVRRDGETGTRTLDVAVDTLDSGDVGPAAYQKLGLGLPLVAPRIAEVFDDGAAAAAGVKPGDLVVRVDGRPVADAQSLRQMILAAARDGVARPMQWEVSRAGGAVTLTLTPHVTTEGGERVAMAGIGFERVFVREGALDAIRLGVLETWRTATGSLRLFARMLTGHASLKNLSGPGTIAEFASTTAHQGLVPFLGFLAMVSVGLGVLNLLPIPMLDGGTLLYYLFEGATGRPVSELWQTWLQRGGVLILLLLMSIALSNDVARHLGLQ
jgi:regulator of sigma E protease